MYVQYMCTVYVSTCVHVIHGLYLFTVCAFVCRQKITISKLQQDVHESEAKLRHLMVTQAHEHGCSALEARLQVNVHVHQRVVRVYMHVRDGDDTHKVV